MRGREEEVFLREAREVYILVSELSMAGYQVWPYLGIWQGLADSCSVGQTSFHPH